MSTTETRRLIDQVFREEALVLGGLAAVRELNDKQVGRLVQSLSAIRDRAHERLTATAAPAPEARGIRPHPAIEEFLAKLEAA